MPIIRMGTQLLYYAHVPKCGGSSIENYLMDRFGQVGFLNKQHHALPRSQRWSQTSPQHIDLETLKRLFPEGFFDHCFTVVRHPIKRLISAYHFQIEVEHSTPANISFSFWLEGLADTMAGDPFVYDNHTRPMVDLVPDNAKVFHLEHGLDAIVPWLDELTGTDDAPRVMGKANERKKTKKKTQVVEPSKTDIDLIVELYAKDFERFGYEPDVSKPLIEPPHLSAEYVASRDAELSQAATPGARASTWLRGRLERIKK